MRRLIIGLVCSLGLGLSMSQALADAADRAPDFKAWLKAMMSEHAPEGARTGEAEPAEGDPAEPGLWTLSALREEWSTLSARLWDRGLRLMLRPCRIVGHPNGGRLKAGARLTARPGMRLRTRHAWGTPEVVAAMERIHAEFRAQYPLAPDLVVTEISRRRGGRLRPHRSHQTGQDVDLLVVTHGASSDPMDLELNWALIRAIEHSGLVDRVLLDYWQQARLFRYGRDVLHVSQEELGRLFAFPRGRRYKGALFAHARGHRTHYHLRFRSPDAYAAQSMWLWRQRAFAGLWPGFFGAATAGAE